MQGPVLFVLDSSSLPKIDAEVTDPYPPSKVLGMKPQSWLNCQELTYAPRQGLLPGGPASLHAELNSAPGHLGLSATGKPRVLEQKNKEAERKLKFS